MRGHRIHTPIAIAAALLVSTTLISCSGSSSPDATATASTLSGVAATGSAMAGATITIMDGTGAIATKTADSNGAYSVDVTSLTAPFVMTAALQTGDTQLSLTSITALKPATGSTGTVNITPLTNAIAALLAPHGNPAELADPTVAKAVITTAQLATVTANIKSAIGNVLQEAGLDPTSFDPISTPFVANRTGADKVLETVRVAVTGQGVSLSNALASDDGNGSASVQITAATTSRTIASVPSSLSGLVIGALDPIASLFETCLAAPAATRVTAATTAGIPTAVSTACAALPATISYKSGGFTFLQTQAVLLQGDDYTGAKFGKPEVLYSLADGSVVFRMSYTTAAGAGGVLVDTAKHTSPSGKSYQWEITGNQRDYDSGVDARLDNITELNPAQPSDASQYGVSLRLFFNPTTTAALNVQMVRVKGPGLPAAGVVLNRSNTCGTDTFMTITNKTGKLTNSSNSAIAYNTSSANVFHLATVAKTGTYDWSKVSTRATSRDTLMSDADLAAIPSYAQYTWELWFYATGPTYRSTITDTTTADFTYTQRAGSRVPSVGSLATMPWNTIATGDFLNPTGALLSAQTSATVNWTPKAETVDYVTVTGKKYTAATASGTAASNLSGIADSSGTGIKPSARTVVVTPAGQSAGTATAPHFEAASCANAQFPAFDGVAGPSGNAYGSYRQMTIRSKTYNLARKYVSQSWSNFTQ